LQTLHFISFLWISFVRRNALSALLQDGHCGGFSEMSGGLISAQRKWRKPRKQLENQSRAPPDWLVSETQRRGINISCRLDPLGVGNNYFCAKLPAKYICAKMLREQNRWSGSYCEFATSAPVVLLVRERRRRRFCSHLHTWVQRCLPAHLHAT
jgi:hypothetical protein